MSHVSDGQESWGIWSLHHQREEILLKMDAGEGARIEEKQGRGHCQKTKLFYQLGFLSK